MESGIDLSQFASSSSKEDWAKTGHNFFENGRFSHARQAYEIAGLDYLASKAEAYQLQEAAKLKPVVNQGKGSSARSLAFKTASDAFLRIAPDGGAESTLFYREAVECLLEVPDKRNAAEVLSLVGDYTDSAMIFRELNLFDRAVDEVSRHKDDIAAAVVEHIHYAARLYYFREGQVA